MCLSCRHFVGCCFFRFSYVCCMFGGVWRVVIWDIYMGYLYLSGLVVCCFCMGGGGCVGV